jgi:hypothetical protein
MVHEGDEECLSQSSIHIATQLLPVCHGGPRLYTSDIPSIIPTEKRVPSACGQRCVQE